MHPGDEWQYGDSTDYVAVLVEKISGQSIDDFLREVKTRGDGGDEVLGACSG